MASNILQYLNTIVSRDGENSKAGKIYDIFMLTTIFMSLLPLMFASELPEFVYIEKITVAIFIFDYVARWVTAPIRMKKGKFSFLLYPFYPMSIIDLLSILPALNLLGNSFKLFRLTRLPRIVRVLKFFRYSSQMEMLGRVLYKERKVLVSVLMVAVIYIFVTALIIFNVEPHINGETGEPIFKSFIDALYWATITLTTVGYGDICPVTSIGRLISVFSALFGVAIIALPSGVITAGYLDELRNSKKTDADNG